MTAEQIQEIRLDEQLPQLEAAMDATFMQSVFQQKLMDDCGLKQKQRVAGCRIIQIRYKPGKKCLISYSLKIIDLRSGQSREQILYAQIYSEDESLSRFVKASDQFSASPTSGSRPLHIPELEMVVRFFPDDRKLRSLPLMADTEYLSEVVNGICGAELKIAELKSSTIHYVAEHTCTIKVAAKLISTKTEESRARTFFGKTYYNDEGATAWRSMCCLWESDDRRAGRLLMAEPLAYQAELKTLWQAGLHGAALADQAISSVQFIELLRHSARAVAMLHHARLPHLRAVSQVQLCEWLADSERLISSVRAECETELSLLISRLIAQAPRASERPVATLHGDLHLKNFFVTDEGIALIDLDNLCLGDPLQDVGSFIAGIHYRGLIAGAPFSLTRLIADEFTQSYQKAVEWEWSAAALNWHIAAALIYERAARCVTRLKTGRLSLIDELVRMAGQYCERLS